MMNADLIDQLAEIAGAENVLHAEVELMSYGFDATLTEGRPDVVVFARTTEQVAEVMKFAYEHDIPVTPRGTGSGLSGGSVPLCGGISLVVTRMDQILELNTDDFFARVEPGVIVADLIKAVAKHGLLYPPDPSSMKVCTMGGAVCENAGGLRGLKYGVTKDYVIALKVVSPEGRVFRTGALTMKHVSGYDLTKLFVGSEGTLGIVTEITVKLIPAPEARRSLMAVFGDIRDAARTVSAVIKSGVVPCTLEILDRITINAVEDFKHVGLPRDADGLLLFECDGAAEVVVKDAEKIVAICREHHATEIRVAEKDSDRDAIWEARRAALPSLARVKPTCILEDATVPRSRVLDMFDAINAIAKKHNLIIGTFGHAGDGNLHPTIICDERDHAEMARVELAVEEIFDAALSMGGTLSGEHGIGVAKKKFLEKEFGAEGVAVMRSIKRALDPKNLLNPGKMFEEDVCLTH